MKQDLLQSFAKIITLILACVNSRATVQPRFILLLVLLLTAQSTTTLAGNRCTRFCQLHTNNVQRINGNALPYSPEESINSFANAVLPGYNELLITEIMADESPAVGLPEQEYIELYNPTDKILTLKGIKYSDATSTATFPQVVLQPKEYAVVVPNSQVQRFSGFGKVIGISNFPSLNNSGELLQLRQPTGGLIYAVNYTTAWYKDTNKQQGGWSLEMVDVTNPCGGAENWIASTDARGGTPAQANAAAASNPDNTPPVLLTATVIAPNVLQLTFNEKLDSTQAASIARYSISAGVAVVSAKVLGPLFTEVVLHLSQPLQEKQRYTLTATSITDCAGNLSAQPLQAFIALPSAAAPGDVVLNELLFNPRPGGVDFVEVVNRSDKYINLKNWQLASGDSANLLKIITTANYVLAPGQYVALTSNPENIKQNYPAAKQETFLQVPALPSYPDEAGTVVLLQAGKQVIDQFSYSQKMHFALLDDVNGVSLERVRLAGPSTQDNFHSAATGIFATPGYANSQAQGDKQVQQLVDIVPKVFSPDGDGIDDFTTINYAASKLGLVANITIFDAYGREIRKLVRNELLAANGFFQWDGLKADGTKAAIGYYVFYIELFGLHGENYTFKEKVVVAGRLP